MKQKKNQKEQGITILSLVITIIIMLILAGVTLNLTLGDNGLIDKTKQATEKYEGAQNEEENGLQDLEEEMEARLKGAGEETEIPSNKNWDTSIVTPTSDGKGYIIPIPKGFYYAGGNRKTGFVISDVSGDDLNNSGGGNQFVWIPCTEQEYEDAKNDVMDKGWSHNTPYETNGTSTAGNGLAWSDDYTSADITNVNNEYNSGASGDSGISAITSSWEKNQTSKAKESIRKYGGFYIARYEAGIPSNAGFYVKGDLTYDHSNRGQTNKAGLDAIKNLSPVSKKGEPVWNYISQASAKIVAENMYKDKNKDSVGSYLVDSQAWNVICNLFASIGKTISNSTNWGNYYNNTTTNYTKINGFWAKHGLNSDEDKDTWDYASTYNKSSVTAKADQSYEKSSKTYKTRIELATGVCNDFKAYNIYDMAGNVWEWTTAHNIKDSTMYVILRGGSFKYAGNECPVVHAEGDDTLKSAYSMITGFRVVLYMK